jgi:hypothetical protein
MDRNMKKLLLVLVGLGISQLLCAQRNGVYLSYEDYLGRKVIEADRKSMHVPHGRTGIVRLRVDGVRKRWKLSEIWGARVESQDFRSTYGWHAKNGLVKIIVKGIYVYYYAEKAKVGVDWTYAIEGEFTTHYYLSKTLTSQIYEIKLRTRPLNKFIKAHADEFSELAKYRAKYPDLKAYKVVPGCINETIPPDTN